MMDQFAFQRAEEAFHWRIVVPGADAIHARADTMVLQQDLIGTVRVLTALIGMVDEAGTWLTLANGHLQGTDGQVCRHPFRHR